MRVKFEKILQDYMALRGESPDLLPLLDEGEEGAVLTLARQLRAWLPKAAIEATLATPCWLLDEMKIHHGGTEDSGDGSAVITLPDDFLKFYMLDMDDWKEPVFGLEPEASLRRQLGAEAPSWMICPHKPMVLLERSGDSCYLRVFGTGGITHELRYIPIPEFDGETLVISEGAYGTMLSFLLKEAE